MKLASQAAGAVVGLFNKDAGQRITNAGGTAANKIQSLGKKISNNIYPTAAGLGAKRQASNIRSKTVALTTAAYKSIAAPTANKLQKQSSQDALNDEISNALIRKYDLSDKIDTAKVKGMSSQEKLKYVCSLLNVKVTTNGFPKNGGANTHWQWYKDGKLYQERWFDDQGLPIKDRHHTDHGNPKTHPKVPHDQYWKENEDGNRQLDPKEYDPNDSLDEPNDDNDDNENDEKVNSILINGLKIYIVINEIKEFFNPRNWFKRPEPELGGGGTPNTGDDSGLIGDIAAWLYSLKK